jgi:hypothetical protein
MLQARLNGGLAKSAHASLPVFPSGVAADALSVGAAELHRLASVGRPDRTGRSRHRAMRAWSVVPNYRSVNLN